MHRLDQAPPMSMSRLKQPKLFSFRIYVRWQQNTKLVFCQRSC